LTRPEAIPNNRAMPPPLRFLSAALLLAVCLDLASASCRSGAVRLVLVTLDTLRYDSFAGAASAPSLMPLSLARARKGRLFEHALAATTCTQPTHATIFTGLQPWEHGVTANGRVLEERYRTLAEILSQDGFETAAVVASVPVAARFGFGQGFGSFREPFTHGLGAGRWEGKPIDSTRFYALAGTVTQEALRLLDGFSSRRQFLWVHYFDAHSPYGDAVPGAVALTPTEVLRRIRAGGAEASGVAAEARELYDGDVRALDGSLDRLLERLERDAPRIETHVVVTADHGESLGEDRIIGHGNHLTPEQVHVPLFVLSPRVPPGHDARPTGSIDLFATLLDLAGVKAVPSGGCDLAASPRRTCLTLGMRRTYDRPVEALRLDGSAEVLSGSLFYVADDAGRLFLGNGTGLLEPVPEEKWARGVTGLFRSFEGRLAGRPAGPALDPEAERALHALGYLP
jgi:arylsulfatase A-like enzyme